MLNEEGKEVARVATYPGNQLHYHPPGKSKDNSGAGSLGSQPTTERVDRQEAIKALKVVLNYLETM